MRALSRSGMWRAIAMGAVLSAPLFLTPCGSSVPVGRSTVVMRDGTTSRNSIQLMRSISRVETKSCCVEVICCLRISAKGIGRGHRRVEILMEPAAIGVEQLFDTRAARGSHDQPGVVFPRKAPDDLRIVVGRRSGPLLA